MEYDVAELAPALSRDCERAVREGRLTVGPNARLMADVQAREVVIFGLVEGNIRATGRIELRASAVVRGDLFAERLSIEENASVKGRVELLERTAGAGAVRTGAEISTPDVTVAAGA